MDTESRNDLYQTIVSACQVHGFTTEHSYELIENLIDSIVDDPESEERDDA